VLDTLYRPYPIGKLDNLTGFATDHEDLEAVVLVNMDVRGGLYLGMMMVLQME